FTRSRSVRFANRAAPSDKNRGTTKPSHDVYLYVYQVRSLRSLPIKSYRVPKKASKCQKLRVVFATPIYAKRCVEIGSASDNYHFWIVDPVDRSKGSMIWGVLIV